MEKPSRNEQMSAKSVDSGGGRRHSISCDPRDRSVLHSASDTRLPLRILARSMVSNSSTACFAPTPSAPPPPSIDVKFIQMYVKKLGPGFRQNSDPTFNRRHRRQRSSDTTATNSGHSSSLASSNDDFPNTSAAHASRSSDHMKSIVIVPMDKRGGVAAKVHALRKSASGSDLKETLRKTEEISLTDGFSDQPVVTCYRILESLFASGADAASNSALLCRLKIDHVIDLRSRSVHSPLARKASASNKASPGAPNTPTSPFEASSSLRCVCADSRHKRHLVNLNISGSNTAANMIEGFKRMNAFITKARVKGEKTLLFDDDSRGTAPAAVIEYLMYYYRMRYAAAKAFVSEIINDMSISKNVEQALLLWQEELALSGNDDQRSPTARSLHQTPEPALSTDSPPITHKKQVAWI